MGNRKKYLIIIVIILLLVLTGGFLFYPGIGQKGSASGFRMTKVELGEINFIVTATGTINPVVNVLVGSQVSGTIKNLYADFNSQVKEEQVVAQIDPAIFQAQVDQAKANVLTAQANLLSAQASLENAKANLTKADVAVLDAKKTLDRNRPLMERNVIAQATMDTAQTNYDTAVAQQKAVKAQLESAKSQVESSKAQVEQTKAALKLAETNLRYTTIRSPVNGTVISRNVDVGQTVAASLQAPTLFTIAKDLTKMQVDTNVSEADVGRITVGQDSTFTVDAYPERIFRGKVSEIRNAPIIVQNVVTYDVVILVDNRELKLKPGMTANVTIVVAYREGILKIPNAALRFQPQIAKKENGPKGKKNEEPQSQSPGKTSVARFTERLNLTPDQQAKVDMIIKASRQEIQEIREKSKPEEARVKIQNLIRQKIMGILTAEQRQKLAESTQSSQADQGRLGKVWILSPEKKPIPVSIVLGITDGTFSEVVAGDLREGMEVIVEETSSKKGQSQSGSAPPFMRGMGR
ncbi:MAG: efflux RND transporter periplasmic adaptor subunit [Thermodesulfobacteriota bacterium]